MKLFGKELMRARKARKMTQNQLAQQMHVARTTISNWETGRSQPDLELICRLSRLLRYSFLGEELSFNENQIKTRFTLVGQPVIECISHGNRIEFRLNASFSMENDSDFIENG